MSEDGILLFSPSRGMGGYAEPFDPSQITPPHLKHHPPTEEQQQILFHKWKWEWISRGTGWFNWLFRARINITSWRAV